MRSADGPSGQANQATKEPPFTLTFTPRLRFEFSHKHLEDIFIEIFSGNCENTLKISESIENTVKLMKFLFASRKEGEVSCWQVGEDARKSTARKVHKNSRSVFALSKSLEYILSNEKLQLPCVHADVPGEWRRYCEYLHYIPSLLCQGSLRRVLSIGCLPIHATENSLDVGLW